MERRLVFLLGSGVSRAANMPSVDEITEAVVSGVRDGRSYWKCTDGWYSNSPAVPGRGPDPMVSVLAFIREVQGRCSKYFARGIDYEDIAYVVWQVHDEQSGNYENPALAPLIRSLRRHFKGNRLIDLAREANAYILCVVQDALSQAPSKLGRMPCLVEACRETSFDHIDVFTLNHDTLIEQELKAATIDFTDGFELKTNTCDYWVTEEFTRPKQRIRLGKLHGSVDWYLYRPDPGNPTTQLVGKRRGCDPEHACDFSGKLQWTVGGEGVMLVGTFNKILEYSGGIFADLFCTFRSALRTTEHLVVSGYGFRDKGVNSTIIEWLRGSSDRRLTIIHKNHLGFTKTARLAIRHLFETNGQQITGTGTWFEDLRFVDLQLHLPSVRHAIAVPEATEPEHADGF